jgi:apolipoprotein N-acyltransferase
MNRPSSPLPPPDLAGAGRRPTAGHGPVRRFLRAACPPLAQWKAALPAFGLAILSGVLARLTIVPFEVPGLVFVALVPWLWGLRGKSPGMAFWLGLAFSSVHIGLTLEFLRHLDVYNPLIVLGLPAAALILGLHGAVASSLAVAFGRRLDPWLALPLSMAAWAGLEWWRSIGPLGTPFGLLGHGAGSWLEFAQLASIGGVPLVSALVFGCNLALMGMLATLKAKWGYFDAGARLAVMAALVGGGAAWGASVMNATDGNVIAGHTKLRIAMLQSNIPQLDKYRSYSLPDRAERMELQDQLTRVTLAQIDRIGRGAADLIVTPESAFTVDFFDRNAPLQREIIDRARDLRTPMMIGAIDTLLVGPKGERTDDLAIAADPETGEPKDILYHNAIFLFRPDDAGPRVAPDYIKVHLAPFGETVPYLSVIPGFAENIVGIGALTPGDEPSVLAIALPGDSPDAPADTVTIGPSICFEDVMAWLHRVYGRRGVRLFVNMTNDGWFDPGQGEPPGDHGKPTGSAVHADVARWRCIENRVPMVRVTNTGRSMVIDGTGRVVSELPVMERHAEIVTVEVPRAVSPTLHARLGDWFGGLALVLAAGAGLGLAMRPRREEG